MQRIAVSFLLCAYLSAVSPAFFDALPSPLAAKALVANSQSLLSNIISFISAMQQLSSSTQPEALNQTCQYLAANSARLMTALIRINQTLQSTPTTQNAFNNTLAFINSPLNQMSLASGTSSCIVALNGLKNALLADINFSRLYLLTGLQNQIQQLQNFVTALINGNP